MAKQLPSWEFKRMGNKNSGWSTPYLDGEIWELTTEDSPNGSLSLESMRGSIRTAAIRRGLNIHTQILREYDEDGEYDDEASSLIVQAFPDERYQDEN